MAARLGRRSRPRFTILVMVLISVTVLTLDSKNVPVLSSVRSGMLDALGPVESGFQAVARPFRNAWRGMSNYDDLEQENRALRAQLDSMEGSDLRAQDAEEQVRKLKEQLGLPFAPATPTILAQVATGNFSSFDDSTAQIDRGSDSGVAVGNPVVTAAGLVGRVVRVSSDRSVVQLITDRDLNIGVRLKSNDLGVGRGTGAGKPFVVDRGIGLSDPVAVGDPVTTSGLERAIFPPEIPIGTVSAVTRSQADQSQVLEVAPAADLSRLDYVQVLRWVPPS